MNVWLSICECEAGGRVTGKRRNEKEIAKCVASHGGKEEGRVRLDGE